MIHPLFKVKDFGIEDQVFYNVSLQYSDQGVTEIFKNKDISPQIKQMSFDQKKEPFSLELFYDNFI